MSIFAMVSSMGMSGLLFIVWYFDIRKEKERMSAWVQERHQHDEKMAKMAEYQGDLIDQFNANRDQIINNFDRWMGEIRTMYENNVSLVHSYNTHTDRVERLANEAIKAITAHSEVQAAMLAKIEANQFCPIVKDRSGFQLLEKIHGKSDG